MKKKVLILSALMAVVFGAVSLQSCSSDDNYTTTEYGYYTEEEISAIKAMAKKYGLSIELNENYYGPKRSLYEHENEMMGLSSLLGEHELVQQKRENGKLAYTSRKRGEGIPRSVTRFIEGEGSWSDSKTSTPLDFNVKVTINWKGDGTEYGVDINGDVEISKGKGIYSDNVYRDYTDGTIHAQGLGMDGIEFSGTAFYAACKKPADNPNDDIDKEVDCFGIYNFVISSGYVSTGGGGNGTFTVKASGPEIVYENDK